MAYEDLCSVNLTSSAFSVRGSTLKALHNLRYPPLLLLAELCNDPVHDKTIEIVVC